MKTILEEYEATHQKSKAAYERAKRHFPSGVTHDTRYLTPFPIFMERGSGARKWDIDGHEYVCYVMGHGALILGHSHPVIVAAVTDQVRKGTHLGSNTELEIQWAEAAKRLMPSIEQVRFVSSGTEATLMAIRLARAYTKRNKVVKFIHNFHGWHDYVIADAGKYSSSGIPSSTSSTVVRLTAGDIQAVHTVLTSDPDVAAVILEPTGAMMGCLPITPEYLAQLREITSDTHVTLIFDEVVTGFRVSPGGAQERYQIWPDLTALGKILGGGLPGGAVGGKRELMEQIAFRDTDAAWNTSGRVSHPGTFNANPLSAVAGLKCLSLIAEQPINRLADQAATRLKAGFNDVLRQQRVTGYAYGLASLAWVVFGIGLVDESLVTVSAHESIKKALATSTATTFKRGMLNAGVDIMGTGQFIVSASHKDRDIEDTVAAFEKVIVQMKAEEALDS